MSVIDQAKSYLFMADKDLRALAAMGDHENFDVEIFGFHVQQAVEKGLKAWLCLLDARFPKKHDLLELNSLLGKAVATLSRNSRILFRIVSPKFPYEVTYWFCLEGKWNGSTIFSPPSRVRMERSLRLD